MTMSLDEAVSTVQRFAKQYEAVLTLAAEIDKVKKIDQLSAEANDRRSAKLSEVSDAEKRLNDLQAKIQTAESELADTKIRAAQASETSKAFADGVVNDARKEAERILSAASNEAAQIRSDADAKLKEVKLAQEAISKAGVVLNADLADKRKELAVLESKIDEARRLVASFVG